MRGFAFLPLTIACCVGASAGSPVGRQLDQQDVSVLRGGTQACYRVFHERGDLAALLVEQGWRTDKIGGHSVLVWPREGGGEYIAYFYPDSLEGPYGCTLVIPDVSPEQARSALAGLPDPAARAFFATVVIEGENDTILRIRDEGGKGAPPFHLLRWWAQAIDQKARRSGDRRACEWWARQGLNL